MTMKSLQRTIGAQPLSQSLPAALRIANAIDDQKWASWIKLELVGYTRDNPELKEDTIVPEYRSVAGLWHDHYGRPLMVESKLSFINEVRLRHGIVELESFATRAGPLWLPAASEAEIINTNLGVEIHLFRFDPSSIQQVLTNVRVRLIESVEQRSIKIDSIPGGEPAREGEIFQLKPTLYGIGIDLKELWRRMFVGRR